MTWVGIASVYVPLIWGLLKFLIHLTKHESAFPPPAPQVLEGRITLPSDTAGMV